MGDASFRKEREAFFSLLDNYIPLGCLVQDFDEPEAELWADWRELSYENTNLSLKIRSFVRTGGARIFGKVSNERQHLIFRFYYLPQDVGRHFHSQCDDKHLSKLLDELVIDTACWNGSFDPKSHAKFDLYSTASSDSLFYLFNTLPSPSPDLDNIKDNDSNIAVRDVLSLEGLQGLKPSLYPYQRRTVASMIEKEAATKLHLDPRLEKKFGPTGVSFYYDPREFAILKHPRYFEDTHGGILAETMGLGKTLIALSLILATKDHIPKRPPLALKVPLPVRPKTASLADMAAASTIYHALPWKTRFRYYAESTGEDVTSCTQRLDKLPVIYKVPYYRSVRNTRFGAEELYQLKYENKCLCNTTIIVVPLNILSQWQLEISKHIKPDKMKFLVMDKIQQPLPKATDLLQYDFVLFSKARFEKEICDGTNIKTKIRYMDCGEPLLCNCSPLEVDLTRDVYCNCILNNDVYISPLRRLHWLRVIVDEGHNYASSISNAVLVADKLVTADRRWVITGTPLKDIVSVDVDPEILSGGTNAVKNDERLVRQAYLDHRRRFCQSEDRAAVQSLGVLAANFLKVQPWTPSGLEKCAQWNEYAYRHQSTTKHTYSGLSDCLHQSLRRLIVKTRPEDVERDISLPPLTHNIVRLQPSFYDKLTANVFNLVLTANAVTSERSGVDYLFHKKSGALRSQLITNLRQSNFFWTGFSESDVLSALKHGQKYLENPDMKSSLEDRNLLIEALGYGQQVLCAGWKTQSTLHEPGFFLENWPRDSREPWDMENKKDSPSLVGEAQLLHAQSLVNSQLHQYDPFEGLNGLAVNATTDGDLEQAPETEFSSNADNLLMGVPLSVFNANRYAMRRGSAKSCVENTTSDSYFVRRQGQAKKRKMACVDDHQLPDTSLVRAITIVGTVSAKLSYVIDHIIQYHNEEKILVFYDFDNAAFYVAQAMELLDVKHHIYAKGLSNELRARYISEFTNDHSIRVMLLDIRCAALGLNINAASRIIFINPVCRPNIEAQAIKRAHRIGQTRPVKVETLLLAGSVEEAIFERARAMTRQEHHDAAKALEDDIGVAEIIKRARPLPITSEEVVDRNKQMARLKTPQKLFARPNRGISRSTVTRVAHKSTVLQ